MEGGSAHFGGTAVDGVKCLKRKAGLCLIGYIMDWQNNKLELSVIVKMQWGREESGRRKDESPLS